MRESFHINACISDIIWRQFLTYGEEDSLIPNLISFCSSEIFLFNFKCLDTPIWMKYSRESYEKKKKKINKPTAYDAKAQIDPWKYTI